LDPKTVSVFNALFDAFFLSANTMRLEQRFDPLAAGRILMSKMKEAENGSWSGRQLKEKLGFTVEAFWTLHLSAIRVALTVLPWRRNRQ
jgi:hypothetical protein